ncbi:hypothetical protein HPB52_022426 [Rhipicephalus sanguineus]|uniref:Uncharacterized protein n=1 Tax=Rhipicephalus sanguineus TaxID=34632 RepID=A0A9D4Q300_RHISA|nr:hypothetical protein HPB52_022426 [Rhipicephalus sanguineus]
MTTVFARKKKKGKSKSCKPPAAPQLQQPAGSRSVLAFALSARPGVIKVRVNSRRNVKAADVSCRKFLDDLPGVTERCRIPVCARVPADRGLSTKYLHGVDGYTADDELFQSVESSLVVVSAARTRDADCRPCPTRSSEPLEAVVSGAPCQATPTGMAEVWLRWPCNSHPQASQLLPTLR